MMEVNRKELYRYLGYTREEPDADIKKLAEDCLGELLGAARPRFFYREYPLKLREDGTVDAYCFAVRSRGLYRNLAGCDRVLLFAATLGAGVDLLIRRQSRLSVSRAVVLQAAGTAAIEAFCDEENEKLRAQYREQDCELRPRFSPGYGDFPLEVQRNLADALEAEKRVGITLTDSLIMVPSKSVTAVIGVEKAERCRGPEEGVGVQPSGTHCGPEEGVGVQPSEMHRGPEVSYATAPAAGCGSCGKTDCPYRKT